MPKRMLKDWTLSDKINSVSVHAERFFTRLIMKADDYGCFYADARVLKANLFPLLLDQVRDADLQRWLDECQAAGLIVVYECESKKYLQICEFDQRLRQKTNKFPLPTNDRNTLTNDSSTPHEGSRSRSRKEEEVEPLPPPPFLESDPRETTLLQMFKRAAYGYDDDFLKHQVKKFLNKYPGCIAVQSGGLINSWAANLNKIEQQKWKEANKQPVVSTDFIKNRDQQEREKLNKMLG